MMTTEINYKKRLKQHRKSTKGHQTDDSSWTAFRREEKKYKAKFPPPSLDGILDPVSLLHSGIPSSLFIRRIKTKVEHPAAFAVNHLPGLVLIPAALSPETQKYLVRAALEDYSRLNETNLHAHYLIPPSGLWSLCASGDPQLIFPKATQFQSSVLYETVTRGPRQQVENEPASLENALNVTGNSKLPSSPSSSAKPSSAVNLLPRLRWANLGRFYHWGTKSYDFSKAHPPLPSQLREICRTLVSGIDWSDVWTGCSEEEMAGLSKDDWEMWDSAYEPDAGIVNFYQLQDTLMGHVDRSEISSTTPLVSISIGRPAIFLIGGQTRDITPTPMILRSGDVVILSGSCRRAYHGVPRILEDQEPPEFLMANGRDWSPLGEYMKNTRININVRQVFPTGYVPPMALN